MLVMLENVNGDVAKELLMVLSYCESVFLERIPKDVMVKLRDLAADSNKEFYIREDKSLREQDLSSECIDLLSELYFMYVLDSNAKKELLKEISNNIDFL